MNVFSARMTEMVSNLQVIILSMNCTDSCHYLYG